MRDCMSVRMWGASACVGLWERGNVSACVGNKFDVPSVVLSLRAFARVCAWVSASVCGSVNVRVCVCVCALGNVSVDDWVNE